MNDTTYTVDGYYTTGIKIRIPREDNTNYKYQIIPYNVSTTTYNAVLLHIVNTKSQSEVTWDGTNSFILPTTIQLPALPIANNDNVLIIVLHDGSADPTKIKSLVNKFYADTDRTTDDRRKVYWPPGGYSIVKKNHIKKNPHPFIPRVVGMTIIKRTQS